MGRTAIRAKARLRVDVVMIVGFRSRTEVCAVGIDQNSQPAGFTSGGHLYPRECHKDNILVFVAEFGGGVDQHLAVVRDEKVVYLAVGVRGAIESRLCAGGDMAQRVPEALYALEFSIT